MRRLLCLLQLAFVVVSAQVSDSVLMPDVTGQALYPASKALRGLGCEVRYIQVSVDTAVTPEFHVAGQFPAAGTALAPESIITIEFSCLGQLRYWEDWVVPLLGDFKHTVGFYRVERPPEPLRLEPAGYPPGLLAYSFTGDCRVEALVDYDGSVLAARVLESSGHAEADSAALDAALRGSYLAAEHSGAPVRVWFTLPYHWEFRDQPDAAKPVSGSDEVLPP